MSIKIERLKKRLKLYLFFIAGLLIVGFFAVAQSDELPIVIVGLGSNITHIVGNGTFIDTNATSICFPDSAVLLGNGTCMLVSQIGGGGGGTGDFNAVNFHPAFLTNLTYYNLFSHNNFTSAFNNNISVIHNNVTFNATNYNFNGLINITNKINGSSAFRIYAAGSVANARSRDGAFFIDNTLNENTSFAIYTNMGSGSSSPLVRLEIDNPDWDQVVMRINSDSTSSQGLIRLDSPAPEIEFVETDQVAPVGKWEIRVQEDQFQINSRNESDTTFEKTITFLPFRAGSGIGINKELDKIHAHLEIVRSEVNFTQIPFIALSSSRSKLGDIFIINGSGYVGIGTETPTQLLDVRGLANFSGDIYINNGTLNFANIINGDCGGTEKMIGIQANGTILCGAVAGGGDFSFIDVHASFYLNLTYYGLVNNASYLSTYNVSYLTSEIGNATYINSVIANATYGNLSRTLDWGNITNRPPFGNFNFTDFQASFTKNTSSLAIGNFSYANFQASYDLNKSNIFNQVLNTTSTPTFAGANFTDKINVTDYIKIRGLSLGNSTTVRTGDINMSGNLLLGATTINAASGGSINMTGNINTQGVISVGGNQLYMPSAVTGNFQLGQQSAGLYGIAQAGSGWRWLIYLATGNQNASGFITAKGLALGSINTPGSGNVSASGGINISDISFIRGLNVGGAKGAVSGQINASNYIMSSSGIVSSALGVIGTTEGFVGTLSNHPFDIFSNSQAVVAFNQSDDMILDNNAYITGDILLGGVMQLDEPITWRDAAATFDINISGSYDNTNAYDVIRIESKVHPSALYMINTTGIGNIQLKSATSEIDIGGDDSGMGAIYWDYVNDRLVITVR